MIKKRTSIFDKHYIIIFLVAFASHLSFLIYSKDFLLWDENVYLSNAKKLLGTSNYSEDFRFPLISWILLFLIKIFGYNVILIKMFFVTLFSFSSIVLFKLIKEITKDVMISYIVTITYVMNGVNIFWASRVYPDVLGESILVFSMYSMFHILNSEKKTKYLIIYPLFSFLSFLSKFYYILWFLLSLPFVFKKNKKYFIIVLTIFSTLFILFLLYNYILYRDPIYNIYEQWKLANMWQNRDSKFRFLENTFYMLGFLFYLPIFYLIYVLYKSIKKNKHSLLNLFKKATNTESFIFLSILYTLLTTAFFLFIVKMKDWRYFTTIIPTLSVINSYVINKYKNFIIPLSFLLLFSTGYSLMSTISLQEDINFCFDGLDIISFSIEHLKTNNASSVLSNFWVWFPNYLGIKSWALWTNNTEFLVKNLDPDFIVYSPNYGYTNVIVSKEFLESYDYVFYQDKCGYEVYIIKLKE